jgi:hypothetical protein
LNESAGKPLDKRDCKGHGSFGLCEELISGIWSASMTRSLRSPQKFKHESHWRDSCCFALAREDEVPHVSLFAQPCDDLAKSGLRIAGQNERTGDSLYSPDSITVGSRGLGVTTIGGRPSST